MFSTRLRKTVCLPGCDPARAALEALGLVAYRERRMTGYQLRTRLGIPLRYELDSFLKEHQIYDYTIEDFEKDFADVRKRREKQETGNPA